MLRLWDTFLHFAQRVTGWAERDRILWIWQNPDIKLHCGPNALSSFKQYLINYGSPDTIKIGNKLISKTINGMSGLAKQRAEKLVERVAAGKDDVYC